MALYEVVQSVRCRATFNIYDGHLQNLGLFFTQLRKKAKVNDLFDIVVLIMFLCSCTKVSES